MSSRDKTPPLFRRLYYWYLRHRASLLGRLQHPNVQKGQRFEVIQEIFAQGLIQWKAPFTSGFECKISIGTVLVAVADSAPVSTGFSVVPEDYTSLEEMLVPEADRLAEKYSGYYFVIPYREIGRRIALVEEQ